jgi:hypothetical protein
MLRNIRTYALLDKMLERGCRTELLEEIRDVDGRSCWKRSGIRFGGRAATTGAAGGDRGRRISGSRRPNQAGGETHGGRSRWDGSSAVPWSDGDERIESKREKTNSFSVGGGISM